jgi:hypothetical protein
MMITVLKGRSSIQHRRQLTNGGKQQSVSEEEMKKAEKLRKLIRRTRIRYAQRERPKFCVHTL